MEARYGCVILKRAKQARNRLDSTWLDFPVEEEEEKKKKKSELAMFFN